MSKAERGYELSSERRPEELRPVVATMPRISAGDTGAQAMQRVADCLAGQILGNWRFLLQSDDPEGIHQLRIGLRRLRSALKALRPVLDGERAISLAKSARELANMLGELRDLDVLATDVVGRIPGDRAGLSLLGEALQSARASRRDSVCSRLASPEWNQLQLSLAMLPQSFAPGGDLAASMPRKPIKALIDKALARQWRRLADQGRRIRKLGVTERHELRKDLKTLRYTSELFATLYPKAEVRKLVRNMRHLQDILGYLNDVALAERLTSLGTNGAGRDVELQRAAGFVIGWHSARAEAAWKGANKAWETLEEAPRFWK
jgi:CHAD domain-containing protein